MTALEFKKAFAIAKDESIDLSGIDNNVIIGYGLSDFKPVTVTLEMVAKEIRWHAQFLFGGWDSEKLNEVKNYGRKSFIIAG
jgi:hypothetical protein